MIVGVSNEYLDVRVKYRNAFARYGKTCRQPKLRGRDKSLAAKIERSVRKASIRKLLEEELATERLYTERVHYKYRAAHTWDGNYFLRTK